MSKKLIAFFAKYIPWLRPLLPAKLQPNLAEGQYWSIDSSGEVKLFDTTVSQCYGRWTTAKLAERLDRFHRNISNKPELASCKFESVMIEAHVAGDLFLSGEITQQALKESSSKRGSIVLQNFVLGTRRVQLEIRDYLYYMDYQFSVTGHPEGGDNIGWLCMRDQPDLLAHIAGEPVAGVA